MKSVIVIPVEVSLHGIEIRVYQGMNGSWNASVLLDKQVFPNPPNVGNRPLTDERSGRWWYDLSASPLDFRGQEITYDDLRRKLDKKVSKLLVRILKPSLKELTREIVKASEHRKHHNPDPL